jgi:hypothetical protein
MTDIEAKALALVNEVQADWNYQLGSLAFKRDRDVFSEALCRAIEQHEAFKQEVSDAVQSWVDGGIDRPAYLWFRKKLGKFIIPKPKPDPLLDIVEWLSGEWEPEEYVKEIRDALEARGFEIREKKND